MTETPAASGNGKSEAEAREAAATWLRGQIAALRAELAKEAGAGKDKD